MKEKSCSVLGIDVAVGTREELLCACSSLLGVGGAISTVNPEIIYSAQKDPELYSALCESLCIPDGIGVGMALRSFGVESEVFAGVELGEALLEVKEVKLGIVGGKEGTAERAMEELVMRHRGVIPEFAISGYGGYEEEFVSLMKRSEAELVFVCLGSPKQELFINKMKKSFGKTVFIALGGSVDVYSGDKRRAPRVVRRMRCEWLWRILREPTRIKRVPRIAGFITLVRKESKNAKKLAKNYLKPKENMKKV